MDTLKQLHFLAPADAQSNTLINFFNEHGLAVQTLALEPSAAASLGGVGVLDLRILRLTVDIQDTLDSLLNEGRWLLINAQKPFADDFLLYKPGVYGLLHIGETEAVLIAALRCVALGELWLPRAFLAQVFEQQRLRQCSTVLTIPELTRREWQVIRGLLAAENNQTISQRLCVAESTVKRHVYNLFRKLGVNNRLEALQWAHSVGLQHEPECLTRPVPGIAEEKEAHRRALNHQTQLRRQVSRQEIRGRHNGRPT